MPIDVLCVCVGFLYTLVTNWPPYNNNNNNNTNTNTNTTTTTTTTTTTNNNSNGTVVNDNNVIQCIKKLTQS